MPESFNTTAGFRYHGDQATMPGALDFAVNVRAARPPGWLLDRLISRIPDLAHYPTPDDENRAVETVAVRHGRAVDEVLLLSGVSEGFALLPNLNPRRAALIAPSFTEPAAILAAARIPFEHVVLRCPFQLDEALVPDDADLVVVGNPTNPTAVLHSPEQILALRKPGRVVVVDEAFADAVPGEAASVAGGTYDDVVVFRSLTKTWSLAGLRVGYALGPPHLLARLASRRGHWPVGTLQMEAVAACSTSTAVAEAQASAQELTRTRIEMAEGLKSAGFGVVDGVAPFILFTVPDAEAMIAYLRRRRITVRRCDTFPGLGANYLRAAVRREWPVLLDALRGGPS